MELITVKRLMKATTTVTKEIAIKPKTLQKLRLELKSYAGLKAQLDSIQTQMDEKKASIGELRESTGEDKLSIDGFSLALVQPIRQVLNHQKLIELGCAVAWIEEATESKPSTPYEKITVPKA